MRLLIVLLATLAGIGSAHAAADVAAGKAKVEEVCAACHGANGVSVSAAIPNLAGQKPAYLMAQLKAFKAGTRKNDIMNAIAGQLAAAEIENVAAYFASLTGATGSAMSEFLPHVAKTHLAFPADYAKTFTKYMTINFPDRKQVRFYYANEPALKAAREGTAFPAGAYFFVEVYTPKLDAAKNPVKGADGFFAPDKLAFYTAMAKGAGWGKDIPEILRNGDWNYAVFNLDKTVRKGANQAECLACHKPLTKDDYVFTIKDLKEVAMKKK